MKNNGFNKNLIFKRNVIAKLNITNYQRQNIR